MAIPSSNKGFDPDHKTGTVLFLDTKKTGFLASVLAQIFLFVKHPWRLLIVASLLIWVIVASVGWPGLLTQQAHGGIAITWTGSGDGTSWSDTANWDLSRVPADGDDVTIDISATVSTTAAISFDTLTIGDGAGVVTSTLRLAHDITVGDDITVRQGGELAQYGTSTKTISGTLAVNSGGYLTHGGNIDSQVNELDLSVATFTLDSGGVVYLNGKGYIVKTTVGGNGFGPGFGHGSGATGGAGGALGGDGGDGASGLDPGGTGYCDVTNPSTIGSAGGSGSGGANGGGSGGGLFMLTASSAVTLNGKILAEGGVGINTNGAGGAGGGVKVDSAGAIVGTPQSFSVAGGNSAGGTGDGGGGGGCVYLEYATTNSVSATSHLDLTGGTGTNERGGAGYAYLKKDGTDGDLYAINSGSGAGSTQGASSITADTLHMDTSAIYVVSTTHTLVLRNGDPFSGGDGTGSLQVDSGGTFTPTSTTNFTISNGKLILDAGGTLTSSSSVDMILGSSGTFDMRSFTTSSNPLPLDTLAINSGGTLTHGQNDTAQTHVIHLEASSSTVASGGSINVDGKGYKVHTAVGGSGNGPGGGGGSGAGSGGGGGHGGAGGAGTGAAGIAYCVTSTPGTTGSAGGSGSTGANSGGSGGGHIRFEVTNTLHIAGTVTADGNAGTGTNGGGGAGGGIYIIADTVAGTPSSMTATGGASGSSAGGGGGGGCIAVAYITANSVSSGDVAVTGGTGNTNNGAAGTFNGNGTPTAPTTLYSNNDDASSGDTNPTGLTDTTPAFSAIYNDPDSGDTANKARIQVSTDIAMDSITHWDSGAGGSTVSDCTQGNRCSDITYDALGSAATLSLALDDDGGEGATDTAYYWRVAYVDDDGSVGAWSATSTFTLQDIPKAPTSVGTSSVTASAITFSWTDNSSVEGLFRIQTSTDGSSFSDYALNAPNATTVALSSLDPNSVHYARVRAENTAGNSSYATSTAIYTLAARPNSFAAQVDSSESITLTWGANSNGPTTTYEVENITTGDTVTGLSATTHTFNDLSSNTTYSFQVRAFNGDNIASGYTGPISATTEGGTGGSNPSPPADPVPDGDNPTGAAFLINDGASVTHEQDVDITVFLSGAKSIALSNDSAFVNSKWETIAAFENGIIPHTLSDGEGGKIVYAKFETINGGVTKVYQQSITYEKIAPPEVEIDNPQEGASVLHNVSDPLAADHHKLTVTGHGIYSGKTTQLTLYRTLVTDDPETGEQATVYVPYLDDESSSSVSLFPSDITDTEKVWVVQFPSVSEIGTYRIVLQVRDDGTGEELLNSNRDFALVKKPKQPKPGPGEFVLNNGNKYTNVLSVPVFAFAKAYTHFVIDLAKKVDLANKILVEDPTQGYEGEFTLPDEDGIYQVEFVGLQDDDVIYSRRALVVLDRLAPEIPDVDVEIEVTENGIKYLVVSGKTEPLAKIVATKTFDGDEPLAGALRIAGVVTQTVDAAANGDWEVSFAQVSDGEHHLEVTSSDQATNTSDPNVVSVQVGELPEVPIPSNPPDGEDPPVDPDPPIDPDDPGVPPGSEPVGPTPDGPGPVEPDGSSPVVTSSPTSTVEMVPTSTIPVTLSTSTPTRIPTVIESVVDTTTQAVRAINRVIDDPQVEHVTEQVATPALAGVAALNVATAAGTLPSIPSYLYLLFSQFIGLFSRRKQKSWGVVFNALTKLPIDLALVRLINDQTNRVVQTRVTDVHGRFGFFVTRGSYRVEVRKHGFAFPAPYLISKTEDPTFGKIYNGEVITVDTESMYLIPNIGLDPQEDSRQVTQVRVDQVKKGIQAAVSYSGVAAAVVAFVISPTILVSLALLFHVLTFIFVRRVHMIAKVREWGVVFDGATNVALSKAVVRIFDARYNKLLETQVTRGKGRYAFLVGPNTYYVTYEKSGYRRRKTDHITIETPTGVIAKNATIHPGALQPTVGLAGPHHKPLVETSEVQPKEESPQSTEKLLQNPPPSTEPEVKEDQPEFDFAKMRELAQYGREDNKGGHHEHAPADNQKNPSDTTHPESSGSTLDST